MLKPIDKITANDIMRFDDCSECQAKRELKELKDYFKVPRIRLSHWLNYNKLTFSDFELSISKKVSNSIKKYQ